MVQEKILNRQLRNVNNEDSTLDYFFSKYNSGQMCSDIIYDVTKDKILHISLDFQKLIGRRYEPDDTQCIPFIKSIIHPEDYPVFLVLAIEFVKLSRLRRPNKPDDFVRSFSLRIKNRHEEWVRINLHLLKLLSSKLVGIIHEQAFPENGESANISAREREILYLIADGDSAKIIGDKLNISPNTVITHRNNLKKKFGVKNTAELIKEAVKSQVI